MDFEVEQKLDIQRLLRYDYCNVSMFKIAKGRVMTKQQTNQQGFTIIEVMLVLAIAALIFLMVFVALPTLQRSQRDTARKSDVDTIAATVTQYTSNNRGKFPTTSALQDYLGDLSNLTKDQITVEGSFKSRVSPTNDSAIVVQGAKCGDTTTSSANLTKASSKQFVVVTLLEGGGKGAAYCLDS